MTPLASVLQTRSTRAAVVLAALLHGAVLFGLAQYQPAHTRMGQWRAVATEDRPVTLVFVAEQASVLSDPPLPRLAPEPAPAPLPRRENKPATQSHIQQPSPLPQPLPHVPTAAPASPGFAAAAAQGTQPLAPAIVRSDEAIPDPQPLLVAKPDYAYNPEPDYPVLLREQGVGGVVWLRVWVDSEGHPGEIKLAKGSGYRLLDDAALRAVRLWRFTPAKRGDDTLSSWVEFPIRFTLNG